MGNFIFVGVLAGLIKTASDKYFSMTANQLLDFAKLCITTISEDLRKKNKAPVLRDKLVLKEVKKTFLDAKEYLKEEIDFCCDREAMMTVYDAVYSLMTEGSDYMKNAAPLIANIKTDLIFAKDFFYGDSDEYGKSIKRLRNNTIARIRTIYGVTVNPKDFSTVLYEHLWAGGSWETLDKYRGGSSFFYWLRTTASRCMIAHLKKEGLININPLRTPGNTKLRWNKFSPDYCRNVIEDMVKIAPMRDFLIAVYVDGLDQKTVQDKFGKNEEEYKHMLHASEKTLKTILLNTINPYDEFLADKKPRRTLVSSDFLALIGHKIAAPSDVNSILETLGIAPDDPEHEKKVIAFLYDFSNKVKCPAETRFVWQQRFIEGLTSEEVLEKCPGRKISWVYGRYSTGRNVIEGALAKWWNNVNR